MARKPGQKPSEQPHGEKQKQTDQQKSHDTFHAHDHGAQQRTQAEKAVIKPQENAMSAKQAHDHDHDHPHDHAHGAATAEGTERGEQTVTVEDSGPARKRITIEIPESRIQKKIEENYGKLRSDALLPGFRRGRAPQRLLEKRFGDSVRNDVKTSLMSESYTQAIEENKLDVIGEPDVKEFEKLKLPDSGPLKFSLEVEVSPKVELPAVEGIEVSKPTITVSDDNVGKEIEQLRERHGKLVAAGDAAAGEGDYLQANVRILAGQDVDPKDEKAEQVATLPGTYVHVTGEKREFKGHVGGIIVDDLGKRLTGKKAGDQIVVSVTGPQGHENEKIRGKQVTIVITINHVERLEPATIEALVQSLGAESESQLRDRVKQMLESRRDREQQMAMHEQVCKYLLDKVDLALPAGLTGRQTERVLYRQAMDMSYRGIPDDEIRQKLAELRHQSEEQARRQLKLFFILDQVAKNYEVEVDEQEINQRISLMAMQQNRRPEKLRQEMSRRGEIEHLYLQIREQKTLDKLLEKAKITEGAAPAASST